MSSTQEVGPIFGEGRGPAQAMLRSPTVLIVSIGLWGMNIFFFRLFRINYCYVLNYDLMKEKQELKQQLLQRMEHSTTGSGSDKEVADDDDDEFPAAEAAQDERSWGAITWKRLILFSALLLFILHVTTNIWIDRFGRGSIGAVFTFYAVVLVYIILPVPANRWLRRAAMVVLRRSYELVNPRCSCFSSDPKGPRPIPFIDVFYADGMCSLSKVFFDWGMLIHMASHYPDPVPPAAHNILIPSAFAAIPYCIRARQCLIMFTVGRIKNDPKRYQHLANTWKYCTSIFPICFSAYQQTLDPARANTLNNYLIILLVVNASYALYWDIVMDWGMLQSPTALVQVACTGGALPLDSPAVTAPSWQQVLMRPRLRFGFMLSLLILCSDTVLRFSWLLKYAGIFVNQHNNFLLTTQFLEVFRRAIWNLLRVEWEDIKQRRKKLEDGNSESMDDASSTEMQTLKDNDIDSRTAQQTSTRLPLGSKVSVA